MIARRIGVHERLTITAGLLIIASVKLMLIAQFGSDLPYRDQWDAEAANLLIPYARGGPGAVDWFGAHNEHRIVLTRLFALALTLANGQWDAIVEACFNIVVHLASAAVLATLVFRHEDRADVRSVLLVVLLVGFVAPFGWINTVLGIQSGFYALLLAAVAMMALSTSDRSSLPRFIAIAALGVVAFLSFGGGAIACLASACGLALSCARSGEPDRRGRALASLAMACIAAIEVALTPTPRIVIDPQAFVRAFHHLMSFPSNAGAAIVWLPTVVVTAQLVVRRAMPDRLALLALGLGAFVALTDVAIALRRGDDVAGRYTDILWLATFANVLLAFRIRWTPRFERLAPLAFAAVATFTLVDTGLGGLYQAAIHRASLVAGEHAVRDYVATRNLDRLLATPPDALPYPTATYLANWLDDDDLRRLLPPSIRASVLDDPAAIRESNLASPGTAPDAPPVSRPTLGTFGLPPGTAGRLESRAWPAHRPGFLELQVVGTASRGDTTIRLERDDGTATTVVAPGLSAGHWSRATAPMPSGAFRLSFAERPTVDPGSWIAFTRPVEVGSLRRACDVLLDHSRTLLAAGIAALVVVVGRVVVGSTRPK